MPRLSTDIARALLLIALVLGLLLGLLAVSDGKAAAQADAIERGRALVAEMCGQCHAIGRTGQSPRAGAPAFRDLDTRLDLDEFTDRLREGLQSSHADMPSFRFSRNDARAVVAYLRFIQAR
jgi:mono/diheme cytochrome c family protein